MNCTIILNYRHEKNSFRNPVLIADHSRNLQEINVSSFKLNLTALMSLSDGNKNSSCVFMMFEMLYIERNWFGHSLLINGKQGKLFILKNRIQ